MIKLQDIADQQRDALSPVGFKRKSSTWRRDVGDFLDVIDFQRDQFSPRFTINIGIVTKSVYRIVWGEEVPKLIRAHTCTIYDRIGLVCSEGDRWWKLDDARAAAEIARRIRDVVLPFMERMHSREEQKRYLHQGASFNIWSTPVYKAILMFECGEREEACALLREQGRRPRIEWILAQLNCSKL
jgi:hypothetical protein